MSMEDMYTTQSSTFTDNSNYWPNYHSIYSTCNCSSYWPSVVSKLDRIIELLEADVDKKFNKKVKKLAKLVEKLQEDENTGK